MANRVTQIAMRPTLKELMAKGVNHCFQCDLHLWTTEQLGAHIDTGHFDYHSYVSRDWVEKVVVDILIHDGPDGHCDGADIITDFIIALLEDSGEDWWRKYKRLELPMQSMDNENR